MPSMACKIKLFNTAPTALHALFLSSLFDIISHVKFCDSSVVQNSHFRACFYRLFSPSRKRSPLIYHLLLLMLLSPSGSPVKSGLGTANYTTSWHQTCCGALLSHSPFCSETKFHGSSGHIAYKCLLN